jgi:hypothetical protein
MSKAMTTISKRSLRNLQRAKLQLALRQPRVLQMRQLLQCPRPRRLNNIVLFAFAFSDGVLDAMTCVHLVTITQIFLPLARIASMTVSPTLCTLLSCHEILLSIVSTSLCANIYSLAGASKLGRLVLVSLWVTAGLVNTLSCATFYSRSLVVIFCFGSMPPWGLEATELIHSPHYSPYFTASKRILYSVISQAL